MISPLRGRRRQLEQTGLVDETSGLLGASAERVRHSPIPDYVWLVEPQTLGYTWDTDAHAVWSEDEPEVDATGMLDAFIRIRTARDVERFARRYGVLGLCENGLPSSHNPVRLAIPSAERCFAQSAWIGDELVSLEPIAIWLDFVDQARTIVAAAVSLSRGETVSDDVLLRLSPGETPEGLALLHRLRDPLSLGRVTVSLEVSRWLEFGNVRPSLEWGADPTPALALWSNLGGLEVSCFGTLAVQLMYAVGRSHGVAHCTGCGEIYLREGRKPQRGRRNYCSTCRESGVPGRQRQQARRERLAREP